MMGINLENGSGNLCVMGFYLVRLVENDKLRWVFDKEILLPEQRPVPDYKNATGLNVLKLFLSLGRRTPDHKRLHTCPRPNLRHPFVHHALCADNQSIPGGEVDAFQHLYRLWGLAGACVICQEVPQGTKSGEINSLLQEFLLEGVEARHNLL